MTTFMAICRTLGINPADLDDKGAAGLVRYGHAGGRKTGAAVYRCTRSKDLFCLSKRNPEAIEGHGPWTAHHEQRFFIGKTGRLWQCSPK